MAGRWGYSVVYFCLVEPPEVLAFEGKDSREVAGGSNLRGQLPLDFETFVFGCHAFAPKCRCI